MCASFYKERVGNDVLPHGLLAGCALRLLYRLDPDVLQRRRIAIEILRAGGKLIRTQNVRREIGILPVTEASGIVGGHRSPHEVE